MFGLLTLLFTDLCCIKITIVFFTAHCKFLVDWIDFWWIWKKNEWMSSIMIGFDGNRFWKMDFLDNMMESVVGFRWSSSVLIGIYFYGFHVLFWRVSPPGGKQKWKKETKIEKKMWIDLPPGYHAISQSISSSRRVMSVSFFVVSANLNCKLVVFVLGTGVAILLERPKDLGKRNR